MSRLSLQQGMAMVDPSFPSPTPPLTISPFWWLGLPSTFFSQMRLFWDMSVVGKRGSVIPAWGRGWTLHEDGSSSCPPYCSLLHLQCYHSNFLEAWCREQQLFTVLSRLLPMMFPSPPLSTTQTLQKNHLHPQISFYISGNIESAHTAKV